MTRARTSERGAALLIVVVAVAVLTALAADLAYESRVSLRIAANARNELQATYLAKSGIALSRLVLSFQRELEDTMGAASQLPGAPSMPRPLLWKIAPVDSELALALFGGPPRSRPDSGIAAAALGAAPAEAAAPAGPAAGAFQVAIEDEAQKVNANLDGLGVGMLPAQVQAFWQLVCDPKWDPLFDREDATGMRYARPDVLINLRDWVDDEVPPTSSALAASFAPNGCAIAVAQNPFEAGFGDENAPYDRGEDRYRAKNARMDSLDELYLVAGIGDPFMAAFGDHLTVYLRRDAKQTVNTLNPLAMLRLAAQMASASDQAKLLDPAFLAALVKTVVERTFGGVLSLSPKDFADIVQGLGVAVDQNLVSKNFTDQSNVYRLRSTARAGDVVKTLDVVLWADKIQPNVPMPGTIRHWREE